MTKTDLRSKLLSVFEFPVWKVIFDEIFSPSRVQYFLQEVSVDADLINSGGQIGTIRLNDGRALAIFKFEVADNIDISRNRKGLRDIAAKYVDQSLIHGALVLYYSANQADYRLTFVAKQNSFNESGQLIKTETAPKRYTFLLGPNEPCTTAANRLYELIECRRKNGSIYLADVIEAFSVERLNKEFFDGYKKQYHKFLNTLSDTKPNRDYVKKLLGRIVFLHFLQKKGWMGVPASNTDWTGGDKNYLYNLVALYHGNDRLLSDVLEPLFFNTLNRHRSNDLADPLLGNNVKIPYLNGGLFDKDKLDRLDIDFPYDYFKDLMSFFSQYNFTIDENDPDYSEVGIDPEMLGHIFENLLEDNKDKGAYYTPKEIVQYMCRESVIQYLITHTKEDQAIENPKESLTDLVNKHIVSIELQDKANAQKIYNLLAKIKVCDPAIGSGAFPMGILNVLFHTRHLLHAFAFPNQNFISTEVKRDIIQNNIYGVDIEQGAVDIARLRFWLTLVVDAEKPQPLPNLDYKIVRGNSLITTFNDEYIQLPENPDGRTKLAKLKKELHQLQKNLFNLNGDEKLQCEVDIKCKILEVIKVQLGIDKGNAQEDGRIDVDIFDEKKLSRMQLKRVMQAQAIDSIKSKSLFILNSLFTALTTPATSLANRAQIDIKFFDWKTIFSNIFCDDDYNSGFDIVIGNPPYIDSETMTATMPGLRNTYKKIFKTAKGNWDIFIPFIELGIDLLKKGGTISFIVPNKLIGAKYAEKARANIQKYNLKTIRDYGQVPVFDAAVYPCVFLLKKEQQEECVIFEPMRSLTSVENSHIISGQTYTSDLFWDKYFIPNTILDIVLKISTTTSPLRTKNITILGAATVGEAYEIKEIIKEFENESDYFKFINTGTIDKFLSLWGQKKTQYIKGAYEKPIVTKDTLAQISYKRAQQASADKIIVAGMSNEIEAFFDNGYYLAGKSTTIIQGESTLLKALNCLLNSKLISFWLNINFNSLKMAGGYINIGTNELGSIPTPSEEKIISSFRQFIQTFPEQKSWSNKITEIDHIVYHLYNLTYDEVLIIDPKTSITRDKYENYELNHDKIT